MGKVTHHVMQPLEGAREKTMNIALKHCCDYQAWGRAQVSAQFRDLTLEWAFLLSFSGTFSSYFMLLSPVYFYHRHTFAKWVKSMAFQRKMKSVFFLYSGLKCVSGSCSILVRGVSMFV